MAQGRWRIAVTGIGLVTPLGLSSGETVRRIMEGDTGAALGQDGVAQAAVPPFDIAPLLRNPKNLKLMSRPVRMGLLAAHEAAAQGKLADGGPAGERLGVYVGSGQTGSDYEEFFKAATVAWEGGREMDFKYLGGMPSRMLDRYFSLRSLANAGVAAISTEFGARGPNNNYVHGETAGASALYNACEDLSEERCDAAVVCAFDNLRVASNIHAMRAAGLLSGGGWSASYTPFSEGRDGLVAGEGAACLILERTDDALERGADVTGEIEGVGLTSQTADRRGFTAEPEDLRDAAMQALGEQAPDWVMARGLGTVEDDRAEAAALAAFLPPAAPVTAVKGHTGYLGAATAIAELGIGLLCARERCLPALRSAATAPDPQIRLNLVRNEASGKLDKEQSLGLFFSSSLSGQVAAIAAATAAASAARGAGCSSGSR